MGLSIDWVARVQKAISRLALNINKPKDLITMQDGVRRWPKRKPPAKTKSRESIQRPQRTKPPKWMMKASQIEAWEAFVDELPWLNLTPCIVGIACEMRGCIIDSEELSVNGYNLLRLCLGQMAATPVDSSKITLPDDKHDADPSDKYFS
jgi:hypothetical protein